MGYDPYGITEQHVLGQRILSFCVEFTPMFLPGEVLNPEMSGKLT